MIGYRVWRITTDSQARPHLHALTMSAQWYPGVNQAVCQKHMSPHVISPAEGCQCGFWMLPRFEQAQLKLRYQMPPIVCAFGYGRVPQVLGAIRAWGRIIEHTDGWRCEKAQVLALWRPVPNREFPEIAEHVDQIGVRYEAPIFMDSDNLIAFVESQIAEEAPGV